MPCVGSALGEVACVVLGEGLSEAVAAGESWAAGVRSSPPSLLQPASTAETTSRLVARVAVFAAIVTPTGWGRADGQASRRAACGTLGRMSACLFCQIVAGGIPAEIVLETERTVAFRDIAPQAPTHVLVVPRAHHENAAALAEADPVASAELVTTAAAVAAQESLTGYRLIFNTGAAAGQTVFHAHLHVLGGRPLSWP